jgi:hypothetical protein
MVHYDPTHLNAVQQPPPVCPKCGSHRTEIVGISDGGQIVLRCNGCGERSVVSLHPGHHGEHEPTPADAVGVELDAMRTVAGALAALDDFDARCRVLRWAAERFGDPASPGPPTTVARASRDADDGSLPIDGVGLMGEHTPEPVAAAPGERERGSIGSMLRGFVTNFQRLAFEWQET